MHRLRIPNRCSASTWDQYMHFKPKRNPESGLLELQLASDPDWSLFDNIARDIHGKFGGTWLKKLDGLDQRYWDLKIESAVLTLHLENYFGIILFASNQSEKLEEAQALLQDVADYFDARIAEAQGSPKDLPGERNRNR